MVPSSAYFHTSVNRLCSEQIFLVKILKSTGKVKQSGKGESVWCSKRSGSKRAQNSVFRGPSDILYQNKNFLAWLSPPPPSSSQKQRNWEILVMLIQDKADTRSESWSPIWSRIYTEAGTPCLWREGELRSSRTQNPKLTSTPEGCCCCCYLWLSGTVLENELCFWHCTAVKSRSLGRPAEAWVSTCGIIPLDSS